MTWAELRRCYGIVAGKRADAVVDTQELYQGPGNIGGVDVVSGPTALTYVNGRWVRFMEIADPVPHTESFEVVFPHEQDGSKP